MDKQKQEFYINYIKSIKEKPKNFLNNFLDEENVCELSVKVLSAIMEKFYERGDEISIRKLMKDRIYCMPIAIFRYLMLFVANKETKMKIYYYALYNDRLDLLSSIRGLTSVDYKLLYESYSKDEYKKGLLAKELNKALKRESVKDSMNDKRKSISVKVYKKNSKKMK